MVLSGGCYPALAVVSSNVFGLNLLSSGLTSYELRKMTKIKMFGSVLLENVPQLIFQALYASTAEFTNTLMFASMASLLSVLAAILSYFIDRDGDDMSIEAVQYYLSLECNRTGGSRLESPSSGTASRSGSRFVGEISTRERLKVCHYASIQ